MLFFIELIIDNDLCGVFSIFNNYYKIECIEGKCRRLEIAFRGVLVKGF